jgi:hypothetical protein
VLFVSELGIVVVDVEGWNEGGVVGGGDGGGGGNVSENFESVLRKSERYETKNKMSTCEC